MVTISKDGAVVRNTGSVSGAPAYRILGDNVRLTNADSGRMIGTSSTLPVVAIEGAGTVLVNELGGIIRAPDYDGLAILGSAYADSVVNEGLLIGEVRLGGGNDSYTHRGVTTVSPVRLGSGNDVYRYEHEGYFAQAADGGSGFDRVVLGGATSQVDGQLLIGFERLEVGAGVGSMINFSGYSIVTLAPGGTFRSFTDSANPLADLAFKGGWLSISTGSVFDDVAGSSSAENLELRGTILGDVALGDGDDSFGYFAFNGETPSLGGKADGGAGSDRLQLILEGDQTFDLSKFSNFEEISVNASTAATKTLRLLGADGFSRIIAESGGTLVLADSNSPEGTFYPSFPSTLQLEATATVKNIGSYFPGFESEAQANDLFSFAVINGGNVLGNVWFYFGDDRYDGTGGSVGGTVYGFAGNDVLTGGAGVDRIEGGYGADTIRGGGGADTLRGGGGADRFVYGRQSESIAGAADSILGFETGIDQIDLRAVRSRSVTWSTTLAGTNIVTVETTTGRMQLSVGGAVAASDFLLTRGMILGTTGDDSLQGTAGNDIFDGGLGIDTMTGGAGNDFYYVDRVGDKAVELGGQGIDTVEASVNYVLPANVEKLILAGGAVSGTGNDLANIISGNGSANTLRGAGGDDVMNGWGGNDTYYVNDSGDKAVEARADGGNDTVVSIANFVLGTHVENLTLAGSAAIDGTGNGLANVLTGNSATNILKGGAGNDTINGGGGADRLYGGPGNDMLKGGTGGDGFHFNSPLNKSTNVDTILDFTSSDNIFLDIDVFTRIGTGPLAPGAFRLGTAAADADDRIIYDQASGRIFYDADGSGTGAAILFAQLTPGTAITSADFIGYI